MSGPTPWIPRGQHALSPHLVVKDAARMIEFYVRAFGAVEQDRLTLPDGAVAHCALTIGDSWIFIADEFPEHGARAPVTVGGTSTVLQVYVEDADLVFERALDEGATVRQPIADMFWGDRYGQVVDPAGHVWAIATHQEDVPPEEMERRGKEWMAGMRRG